MDDAEFARKLDRWEIALMAEQMIDQKIAIAKRQVFAAITLAIVTAVVAAVVVVFTFLHCAAVNHWPS
jgi:hypothetical protein